MKLARHKGIKKSNRSYSTWIRGVLVSLYYEWRIPKDLNLYLKRWSSIDHRTDKSLSGKDFRLWYYLRKCDERLRGGENK